MKSIKDKLKPAHSEIKTREPLYSYSRYYYSIMVAFIHVDEKLRYAIDTLVGYRNEDN